VPQISRSGGEKGNGGRRAQRCTRKGVEVPVTIATKNLSMGLQVLHRETKGVKLNRTMIILSKLANRKQFTNKMGN
jgi:hypothetical protein